MFTSEELVLLLEILNDSERDVSILKQKVYQVLSSQVSYDLECG